MVPGGSVVQNPPDNTGDTGSDGSVPGSGRAPEGGHGNPLQYSCLAHGQRILADYGPGVANNQYN